MLSGTGVRSLMIASVSMLLPYLLEVWFEARLYATLGDMCVRR